MNKINVDSMLTARSIPHLLPRLQTKRDRYQVDNIIVRRLATVVNAGTAAILLASCATTNYEQPILDLQTAIDSSITTINALDAKATATQNARWRTQIADGRLLLTEGDNDCRIDADACRLFVESSNPYSRKQYPGVSLTPNSKASLSALRLYVGRLHSIVSADTVGEVRTATNAALGGVQQIDEAVAKATGRQVTSEIAAFEEPLTAAVSWLVGRYVDSVKRRALASAMRQAQPAVDRLAGSHQAFGSAFAALETVEPRDGFLSAQKAFDNAADAGTLTLTVIDDYVAAANSYNTVLNASALAPLSAFAEAHGQLAHQLNDKRDVSMSDAYAAINRLLAEAKTLKSIVDAFDKAIENSKRGTPDADH